ncbi:MAG: copper-containing nitrite reductase [Rhodospirillales bacterium]|jgi:cytochrome c2|nr:copper-containing nitrite reductase [Rhodospirillales bacterium]
MRNFHIGVTVAVLWAASSQGVLAQDQAKEGEAIFKRTCAVCHTTEPGKNKIGPSLAGIVGSKSAEVPGFSFSDAMKKAGLTWDEATLDKYITDPKAVVPGNKMIFAGLKKPEERAAVIDYLKTQG